MVTRLPHSDTGPGKSGMGKVDMEFAQTKEPANSDIVQTACIPAMSGSHHFPGEKPLPSIPSTRPFPRLALATLAPLAGLLLTGMAAPPGQADQSAANADRGDVPLMSDLEHVEADLEYMQEEQIPMLLFFHATYCSYCRTVDDEFLQTMAESEEHDGRLIIRRVEIDSQEPEIEWQGTSYTPVEFARLQGVELVPEVIYFAPDGKQVVDELKGVTVPDFYPQYLDKRLRAAERCIDDPSLDVCTDGIDRPRRDLNN